MKQHTDALIWILVAAATASVVALAVFQGRRAEARFSGLSAPDLSLPRLDGRGKSPLPHSKVTVVDFWATWCAPCRASMPRVQKVWQEYRLRGLEIYSVDTDDPAPNREPAVRNFLIENGLTFPVVIDDGSAAKAFAVTSLPTMLLLDRQGKIVWSRVGALTMNDERDLRGAIERSLGR